jgi:hypothetical protein
MLKLLWCSDDSGSPTKSIEPSAPLESLLPPEPSLVSAAKACAAVV